MCRIVHRIDYIYDLVFLIMLNLLVELMYDSEVFKKNESVFFECFDFLYFIISIECTVKPSKELKCSSNRGRTYFNQSIAS